MSATPTLEPLQPLDPLGTPQTPHRNTQALIWGLLGALALVVLTAVSYLPATWAGYIWDDNDHVTNNITFDQPHALRRIWFDPGTAPQYYPLAHSIFLAEHHLLHDNSVFAHTLNIVLEVANGLLLWLLLRRLAIPGAWFAAAIWAVHPVNVESVAWVTELKNVLSGFFYLLAALAYFRFCGAEARPPKQRPWVFYWLALAAFILALWSKTVTASLPAAIMLVLWWKGRRVGWREAIPAGAAGLLGFPLFLGIFGIFKLGETTIPMPPTKMEISAGVAAAGAVGLAAIAVALRWRIRWREILPLCPFFALGVAQGQTTAYVEKALIGAEGFDWQFSFLQRLLVAGRVPWFYAWSISWPVNLTFMYKRWEVDPHLAWQWFFPLATVAVVGACWFFRKWIGGGAIVAVTFFILTLFPALGFFDVYPFRYSFVADHFQYLAGIGIIVLAVAAVAQLCTRWPKLSKPVAGAAGALVVVLAGLSFHQSLIYKDLETLWMDTLDKNPDCWLAYNNLGGLWFNRGDPNKAMMFYDRSLAINPRNGEAYNNRAVVWERWAKLTGRLDFLDRAHEDYNRAVEFSQRLMSPRENRAHFLMAMGQTDAALADLDVILDHVPAFRAYNVYLTRAQLRASRDRYEEALQDCQVAMQFVAARTAAYKVAADICWDMSRKRHTVDRLPQAIEWYGKALTDPSDPSKSFLAEVYFMRGLCYSDMQKFEPALADFDRSIAQEPTAPRPYELKAQCFFGLKRYDDAWVEIQKCRAHGGQPDPVFMKALQDVTGRTE